MAEPEFYVGAEPTMFEFEGSPVVIGPSTIVRAGHPILKGRESLFRPLVVHFDTPEPKKAEPKAAEKSEPKAAEKAEAEKPAEKRLHTR